MSRESASASSPGQFPRLTKRTRPVQGAGQTPVPILQVVVVVVKVGASERASFSSSCGVVEVGVMTVAEANCLQKSTAGLQLWQTEMMSSILAGEETVAWIFLQEKLQG